MVASPLGPHEAGRKSLRNALRILLNTNHPMLSGGVDDPHPILQSMPTGRRWDPKRHPSALGQRGREMLLKSGTLSAEIREVIARPAVRTWHENSCISGLTNRPRPR